MDVCFVHLSDSCRRRPAALWVYVLFFSRPGADGWPHTMDVHLFSPFISVLCHSDWLFHGESCPRLDVVHPGRAWSSLPACTWHCSWHCLFLQRVYRDNGLMNEWIIEAQLTELTLTAAVWSAECGRETAVTVAANVRTDTTTTTYLYSNSNIYTP